MLSRFINRESNKLNNILNKIKELEALPAPNAVFTPKRDAKAEDLKNTDIVTAVLLNQYEEHMTEAIEVFKNLVETREITKDDATLSVNKHQILNILINLYK